MNNINGIDLKKIISEEIDKEIRLINEDFYSTSKNVGKALLKGTVGYVLTTTLVHLAAGDTALADIVGLAGGISIFWNLFNNSYALGNVKENKIPKNRSQRKAWMAKVSKLREDSRVNCIKIQKTFKESLSKYNDLALKNGKEQVDWKKLVSLDEKLKTGYVNIVNGIWTGGRYEDYNKSYEIDPEYDFNDKYNTKTGVKEGKIDMDAEFNTLLEIARSYVTAYKLYMNWNIMLKQAQRMWIRNYSKKDAINAYDTGVSDSIRRTASKIPIVKNFFPDDLTVNDN